MRVAPASRLRESIARREQDLALPLEEYLASLFGESLILYVRNLLEEMSENPDLPVDRRWLCEQIVDTAGEAVLFVDLNGDIRLWNDAAEKIFGYSREEALGSSLNLIVPEEFRDAHWHGYEQALDRGETTSPPVARSRVPALHGDGGRIEIETSGARIVTNGADEPVGVFNMIRDVTGSTD